MRFAAFAIIGSAHCFATMFAMYSSVQGRRDTEPGHVSVIVKGREHQFR
jgi:hypothetical protein